MTILQRFAWLFFATLLLLSCSSTHKTGECVFSAADSSPAWNEQKLDEAFQRACDLGTTTLVVVTGGDVVKSMGDLETPYYTHSVRKALLNAIVGQHLGTGPDQINLESTLADLNINTEI